MMTYDYFGVLGTKCEQFYFHFILKLGQLSLSCDMENDFFYNF